jgi:hypothetical protein
VNHDELMQEVAPESDTIDTARTLTKAVWEVSLTDDGRDALRAAWVWANQQLAAVVLEGPRGTCRKRSHTAASRAAMHHRHTP